MLSAPIDIQRTTTLSERLQPRFFAPEGAPTFKNFEVMKKWNFHQAQKRKEDVQIKYFFRVES
jgi:hypothetical protein